MYGLKLDPIADVMRDFQEGRLVIMIDDASRENEGDLVIATEKLTAENVAFMMREARGLICVSISAERAAALKIPFQASENNSTFNTPFGISLDHKRYVSNGVTAEARAYSMSKLIDPEARPEDFISPGHCFPLIAHAKGVLGRRGQTEGSFDLARLCGFKASGVICEILNEDGSMARGAELATFARKHGLKITSVAEIVRYRLSVDTLVRNVSEATLQTDFGARRAFVFEDDVTGKEHLVLLHGDISLNANPAGPLVRLHSECLTGDVFESRRCDCGSQLAESMRMINQEGAGIVLYLRQEGRGIGLSNKLKAYALQDQGHDTVEANLKLGFKADERDFAIAARILNFFKISKVRLLTNNPQKIAALEAESIAVSERVAVLGAADPYTSSYLATKRDKMGHWL